MVAFVIVVVACLVVVVQAVRGDALGLFRPGPSGRLADGGVHLPRLAVAHVRDPASDGAVEHHTASSGGSVAAVRGAVAAAQRAHQHVTKASASSASIVVLGPAVGSGHGPLVAPAHAATAAVLTSPVPSQMTPEASTPGRSHGRAESAGRAPHGHNNARGHAEGAGHGKADGHGKTAGPGEGAGPRHDHP